MENVTRQDYRPSIPIDVYILHKLIVSFDSIIERSIIIYDNVIPIDYRISIPFYNGQVSCHCNRKGI